MIIKDKKAQAVLLDPIIQVIIVAALLVLMLLFVNSYTNSSFVQQRRLVNQIAVLIDAGQPGTTISFSTKYPVEIDKQNQTVIMGKTPFLLKYTFFNTNFDFSSAPAGIEKPTETTYFIEFTEKK